MPRLSLMDLIEFVGVLVALPALGAALWVVLPR